MRVFTTAPPFSFGFLWIIFDVFGFFMKSFGLYWGYSFYDLYYDLYISVLIRALYAACLYTSRFVP